MHKARALYLADLNGGKAAVISFINHTCNDMSKCLLQLRPVMMELYVITLKIHHYCYYSRNLCCF